MVSAPLVVRASEWCTLLGHGLDNSQMFSFFPCCHAKHNRTLTSWFANGNKRSLEKSFWTEHVSLYLDATSFPHKTNLFEQACAPKGRRRTTKSAGIDIMHFKGMKRGDRKNLLSEHTCRNCNRSAVEEIVSNNFRCIFQDVCRNVTYKGEYDKNQIIIIK